MTNQPESSFNFNQFNFDARRDTIDFRDLMYTPTLVEVPISIDLEEYRQKGVPILSQGNEGACTGFGLATVANYLLSTRRVKPDTTAVSPRMFYEMARRYDEWPGENYSGSSARGAMKGWHKHGVCAESVWEYIPNSTDRVLTHERANDARGRPLGAYFRVNHKDLIAMHAALAEVGILYATANVHDGWDQPGESGIITYKSSNQSRGGHAFAIVAYDHEGFWIQNSWSTDWGRGGFAHISYDDWLDNGMDVWVARLGVPVAHLSEGGAAASAAPGAARLVSYSYADLRPHVVSLGNDGRLSDHGVYGTSKKDIETIFKDDIPRLTKKWDKRRILLYAHGGLVGESNFLQRAAEYRSAFMPENVYPLAFIWHTDLWSTITNIVRDAARQRRPEGILDNALDFMLDRLDDTLEAIVRGLNVRGLWDEMKENAWRATANKDGGARFVLQQLSELMDRFPGEVEVHIAGHSAGGIFHAPLVQYFTSDSQIGTMEDATGLGRTIASCTLWAPGIRLAQFHETYLPAIKAQRIERFSLFTLTDEVEQDDNCANIYHKSLLYLVSNALEEITQSPQTGERSFIGTDHIGEPLLGLDKFVGKDPELKNLFKNPNAEWVLAPNKRRPPYASTAAHHGDFDDDPPTLMSTLARILPADRMPPKNVFEFRRSSSSLGDRRRSLP
jgi:hypothetical protein